MTGKRTRLLMLATLALLLGLMGVLSQRQEVAHAASPSRVFITMCTDAQLQNAVNTAPSGATIVFRCSGEIDLTATLMINKDLTLDGDEEHVTLDGQGLVQVIAVNGVTFTLKDLTITGGVATNGGGLLNNGGTVTICDSTFSSNKAGVEGGGIFNDGTMTINESLITNNTATTGNGGGINNGNASNAFGSSTATITESSIANNTATSASGNGGGINNELNGMVTIIKSILRNNHPHNCAGAITNGNGNHSSDTSCGF